MITRINHGSVSPVGDWADGYEFPVTVLFDGDDGDVVTVYVKAVPAINAEDKALHTNAHLDMHARAFKIARERIKAAYEENGFDGVKAIRNLDLRAQ